MVYAAQASPRPLLGSALIVARLSAFCPGAIGLFWFILWSLLVFDSPNTHPRISEEEKIYINASLKDEVIVGATAAGKVFLFLPRIDGRSRQEISLAHLGDKAHVQFSYRFAPFSLLHRCL